MPPIGKMRLTKGTPPLTSVCKSVSRLTRLHRYGSCNFQSVPAGAPCPSGTKPGYINGGSRRTLQALQQQPHAVGGHRKSLAANVNCLVAATHFLPLFFTHSSESDLVQAAVDTVYISHNNPDPIAAAEFLSSAPSLTPNLPFVTTTPLMQELYGESFTRASPSSRLSNKQLH